MLIFMLACGEGVLVDCPNEAVPSVIVALQYQDGTPQTDDMPVNVIVDGLTTACTHLDTNRYVCGYDWVGDYRIETESGYITGSAEGTVVIDEAGCAPETQNITITLDIGGCFVPCDTDTDTDADSDTDHDTDRDSGE
jgi:hypothetical protein